MGDVKQGNEGIFITGKIGNANTTILVDTGSSVTIINPKLLREVDLENRSDLVITESSLRLKSAKGDDIPVVGECTLSIFLGNLEYFHDVVIAEIENSCILGVDFMSKFACGICMKQRLFRIQGVEIPYFSDQSEITECSRIVLSEDLVVPPNCEFVAPARVESPNFYRGPAIVEPVEKFMEKKNVLVAKSLVKVSGESVPLRFLNFSCESLKLYKGSVVATIERVEDVDVENADTEVVRSVCYRDEGDPSALPDHLEQIIDKVHESISVEEKQKLANFLKEYQSSFSCSSSDMGKTDLVKHSINTGNARPIKQPPRRIPLAKMAEVRREIDDMLEREVIETSDSPWSSPIVLVKKKDGTIRFCIDYRKINDVTVKDSYPIPRIDTTLDALSGAKWFSTIDLKSGYWQVEMKPEDKPKTAFSIPGGGHWQFLKMPFGLCNAGATFERLMERVLSNLSWKVCLVYLDDIIILSKTFDEHLENLTQVFERLKGANLKMNPKKCILLQKDVSCLGDTVSEEGVIVAIDPPQIEEIKHEPIHRSINEVPSHRGPCLYHRNLIDKARPLYNLMEKNIEFVWNKDCNKAFDKFRRALISTPFSIPQGG